MALTRATDKIIGDSNGNLNLSGIVTATTFKGNFEGGTLTGDGSSLTGIAKTDNINTSRVANFTGGIQVGGATTLTSTVVGAAVSINSDGIHVTGLSTFTGGVKVPDSTNSDGATNNIHIGNSSDLQIFHNGTDSRIDNRTGSLQIRSDGGLNLEGATSGGNADFLKGYSTGDRRVELYNSDAVKLTTTSSGVVISGIATASQVETSDGTSFLKKHSVGIGTTTTTGRNAGVGTAIGEMIYNASDQKVQIYNGNQWLNLTAPMAATGGTTSSSSGFKYHQFNSSGTFTVSTSGNIDAILVAGGGGGGGGQQSGNNGTGLHGGGGGGGGVVTLTNTFLSSGAYTVVVGDGGGTYQNGNNSTFNGSTAIGGGRGGSEGSGKANGASGGSGGGGTYNGTGGSGTSGQGNDGGNGAPGGSYATGGGGGAGAAGQDAPNNTTGGNGGNGYTWLNGTTYAGGGGGCISVVGTPGGTHGSGGTGGGGAGAASGGTSGTQNTGGGGGGSDRPANGGSGGKGVVIIRYEE